MTDFQPIDTAPRYTLVRVKMESGFETPAEFKSRSCTGMCSPQGQPPHTPHIHDEWVAVNEGGDEIHPIEGYEVLNPVCWAPLPEPTR